MGVPHGNRGSKHAAKRVRNPDTQRSPRNNSHIKDNKRSRGITKNDTINRGDGDTHYHVADSLTPAERYIYEEAKRKPDEPFSYLDFKDKYAHGTIRNTFSSLRNKGLIRLYCRSCVAFYVLSSGKPKETP